MIKEINFWSLEAVEKWLDKLDKNSPDLAMGSLSLLERFTNDIVSLPSPLLLEKSGLLTKYLDKLDGIIKSLDASKSSEIALIYGILIFYFAEMGPSRFEGSANVTSAAYQEALGIYRGIRCRILEVLSNLFALKVFEPLRKAINNELIPNINSMVKIENGIDDHYGAFRVLGVMDVSENLRFFALRLGKADEALAKLLHEMYDYKVIRFGTSGFRGVWERDFSIDNVHYVTQAVCDFLNANNLPSYLAKSAEKLSGQTIVIGYDGRRNSDILAKLIASIALANGFKVEVSAKPSPTPALNFYSREVVTRPKLAGLINCTASHNPPEWQGIKFNPKQGYPAPSSLTDGIANRANLYKLLKVDVQEEDLAKAEARGDMRYFDPLNLYINWLLDAGKDNKRISIDLDNIREFFSDKKVIYDPMYGSGTGYMTKILGMLGIPTIVLHDERDADLGKQVEAVRGIPHLEYANPEPDFIEPLRKKVEQEKAVIGLGLDTDADRFGVVDTGGKYIRPNQILAMLTRYLGVERGITGRVIITQTGLPMINKIAGAIPNNKANVPAENALPAYISHPFYKQRIGDTQSANFENVYVVPVGIKYIVDVLRVPENATKATAYSGQPDSALPDDWMDRLLIGGEESSGLTTKGHVPDKDGIWANLLIIDMLAYFAKKYKLDSLTKIWEDTIKQPYGWQTTGYRIDLDAVKDAKEGILNYFLDVYKDWKPGDAFPTIEGLELFYQGGTRYDFVEMFLRDPKTGSQHFLRVRSSGTEPILRVYVESYDTPTVEKLRDYVLNKLDEISINEVISKTEELEAFADVISNTRDSEKVQKAVTQWVANKKANKQTLIDLLLKRRPHVESRNAKLIDSWIKQLG